MKAAVALLALAALPAVAQERQIVKEVLVKAPVEAVFRAWSTSEGIATFFAPEAKVEARSGGAFEIYFNPYAPPGDKGADDTRVLAVQDNRMISFTWNAPPHLPEIRAQRTFVVVRTMPEGEGQTRVRLTHVGWGDGGQWDQTFTYFDRAWGNVLANLQKRFAQGPIDWAEWRARMRKAQDGLDGKK